MVRMVHTNNFFEVGLEISEPKVLVLDKQRNFGGVGHFKIQFRGPKLTFERFYKTKIAIKNILDYSRPILDQI